MFSSTLLLAGPDHPFVARVDTRCWDALRRLIFAQSISSLSGCRSLKKQPKGRCAVGKRLSASFHIIYALQDDKLIGRFDSNRMRSLNKYHQKSGHFFFCLTIITAQLSRTHFRKLKLIIPLVATLWTTYSVRFYGSDIIFAKFTILCWFLNVLLNLFLAPFIIAIFEFMIYKKLLAGKFLNYNKINS